MKKIICILTVFLGILCISSVAFASDFVAVSSSKFEFTGVPDGIVIKKSDNRNSEITNLIAEAMSEHDNAMIFDLQAYEGENEAQLPDAEIGVNISNSGMSSGYYGYGKDYRIFKIDNETLTPIECIESKNNVTFKIMNVGTYAFVYNTKAFPVTFYSDDSIFYKTEDLSVSDIVYVPGEIPQKEGFIFGGWKLAGRAEVVEYCNYVGNASSYEAKWIPSGEVNCNLNNALPKKISFSNNEIEFKPECNAYFMNTLNDGNIDVALDNDRQKFYISYMGINLTYDEEENPTNISFAVPQNDEPKRIDIMVLSGDRTNAVTYSFILSDNSPIDLIAGEDVQFGGKITGAALFADPSETTEKVMINSFDYDGDITSDNEKCIGFSIVPYNENGLEIGTGEIPFVQKNAKLRLEKSDGTKFGSKYSIYKIESGRAFGTKIIYSDETSVEAYIPGPGDYLLVYTPQECEVTFVNDGIVYKTVVVSRNAKIDAPEAPSKSGYIFVGWYSGENGSGTLLDNETIINSDITFYAYWKKQSSGGGGSISKYTVSFDSDGGTKVNSISTRKNTTINKPENPIKDGYVFEGWYKDKECTSAFDFSTQITKSITLYAKWTEKQENKIILTIGDTDAVVNGKVIKNDVPPIIKNNRTMVPARFIAESLGAEVDWDESMEKVTIRGVDRNGEDVEIILYIDSDKASVNGKEIILDSKPFIENDRTYTPFRFISESFGYSAVWNEDSKTIVIE